MDQGRISLPALHLLLFPLFCAWFFTAQAVNPAPNSASLLPGIAGELPLSRSGHWLLIQFPQDAPLRLPEDGKHYRPGEAVGRGIVVGTLSSLSELAPRITFPSAHHYLAVPFREQNGHLSYDFAGAVTYTLLLNELFPGVYGEALQDSLVTYFKPGTVLSYAKARDTLFARVYRENDSLRCVYTGYRIWLDPTQDPTSYAFAHHINTEHTWPQSKGAGSGNARSDMHHLFPVRDNVNSARGNLPFAEIEDVKTDFWYRLDQVFTQMPSQAIDEYSEKEADEGWFEPREDHKGNAARAMFYFYTMYRAEANAADSTFFPLQKDVLLAWHRMDPVDSLELLRTYRIAGYQEGKPNPFVVDTSLVRRAYFPPDSLPPVVLANFSGAFWQGVVLLQWKTLHEEQVLGFRLWQRPEGQNQFLLLADYQSDSSLVAQGGPQTPAVYSYADSTVVPNSSYTYRLEAIVHSGRAIVLGEITVQTGLPVPVLDTPPTGRLRFRLGPAYPNPFNASVAIPVQVPVEFSATLQLEVYDLLGRRVATVFRGRLPTGEHRFYWEAQSASGQALPSGVYLLRLSAKGYQQVQKIVLVR